jgi:transcriptional regulator with XRE-family HTH domain
MGSVATRQAFGVILQELRNTAKLTQEKLASAADLDRTFVGDLERGEKQPSLHTIFQLAPALNIAPGVMVDKTALLRFPALNRDKSPGKTAPQTIPLGEETCRQCGAIYDLQARRLPARQKGSFRCRVCDYEISTWTGTTASVYTMLVLPKRWPKR